jgi:hypothetical protein
VDRFHQFGLLGELAPCSSSIRASSSAATRLTGPIRSRLATSASIASLSAPEWPTAPPSKAKRSAQQRRRALEAFAGNPGHFLAPLLLVLGPGSKGGAHFARG